MRRTLLVRATCAWAIVLLASACTEKPTLPETGPTPDAASFGEALRASADGTSRVITPLRAVLQDPKFGDISVFEGSFTDIRPDRAWVNLPEDRIKGDVDIEEVPWLDDSAQFRTIVATFEVTEVVQHGSRRTPCGRACTVDVTFALYDLAAMDSARSTLAGLGRSVIVVTEGERGALGDVTRLPGDDLLIAVDLDGTLRMPFSDNGSRSLFLGDIGAVTDLQSAAVASP